MTAEKSNKPKTGIGRRIRVTTVGMLFGWRESVLTLHLRGKIRRFWAVNFRPAYVRRQLSLRGGHCHQCGACCALGNTCPMLHRGRHCIIYMGYRPKSCRKFPLDERDIADVAAAGGKCGYQFTPIAAAAPPPAGKTT